MQSVKKYPGAAAPDWRCNHCHGADRRKVYNPRRNQDVYAEVKGYVLGILSRPPSPSWWGFTKESLAASLGVKVHCVEQALARLNQEGLVNQPLHRYPHDNNRSTQMDGGSDSSWVGDVYRVRWPKQETT